MTEATGETLLPPAKPSRWKIFWRSLSENPVVLKELRVRMRARRTVWVLVSFIMALSGILMLTYASVAGANNSLGSMNTNSVAGKTVFWSVAALELMMACFIAPALTAGAISSERERQTFDLLRTTLLTSRSLVMGKYISAMSFLVLLLFAAFPLQSIAFLIGGVSLGEILIAFMVLLVTAAAFCAIGMFASSLVHNTLASTVMAYVITILLIFGIPAAILVILGLFSSFYYAPLSGSSLTPPISMLLETVLYVIGWFVVSGNPISAVVASEVMIQQEHKYFYTTLTLPNSSAIVPVIAPWISYGIIYIVVTLLMLWLSVRLVRRREK